MARWITARQSLLFEAGAHEIGQVPLSTAFVDLAMSGGGIASAEAFGIPALNGVQGIRPTGIASAQAFGTASVQTGRAVSGAGGIATAQAFGARHKVFRLHTPISISSRISLGLGRCPPGSPIPGPKAPAALRIMAVGDSITHGTGDPASNSWRKNVHLYLTACGFTPTWLGDQVSGDAPSNLHHASPGKRVVDCLSGGAFDVVAKIGAGTAIRQVNVFVIFLGTNDALTTTDTNAYQANWELLIDQIHAKETEARFVAVYLPPSSTRQTNINTINNTQLPAAIASRRAAGRKIVEVDCRILTGDPGVVGVHYLRSEANNWLHPNPDGYLLMGDAIARGVMNAAGYDAQWYGDSALAA